MSEETDDLIDDVVSAARNAAAAFEWGSSGERDLSEAVSALKSRIAALEAQTRWIPVDERLPEYDKHVIACFEYCEEKYVASATCFPHKDKILWALDEGETVIVTHWQPLPEPPEVVE